MLRRDDTLLRGFLIAAFVFVIASMASASTVFDPEVIFTQRKVYGPDWVVTSYPYGTNNFQGLLQDNTSWETSVFFDFDLTEAPQALLAELTFELANVDSTEVVTLSTYPLADGAVQAGDFERPRTPHATFTTSGIVTVDMTHQFNFARGGYLGFVVSINMDGANVGPGVGDTGVITITATPDPCGNGTLEPGEACDDGGNVALDGCSEACQVEFGWDCVGEPSTCFDCANGIIEAPETCDDGAFFPGDGCDWSCQVEPGWTCEGEPSTCSFCGDGLIEGAEACDDENAAPGDGCSDTCLVEPSWNCEGAPSVCSAQLLVPGPGLWVALPLLATGAAMIFRHRLTD